MQYIQEPPVARVRSPRFTKWSIANKKGDFNGICGYGVCFTCGKTGYWLSALQCQLVLILIQIHILFHSEVTRTSRPDTDGREEGLNAGIAQPWLASSSLAMINTRGYAAPDADAAARLAYLHHWSSSYKCSCWPRSINNFTSVQCKL